jgi:zinc/manganese transport system substrate-binding protein
MIPQTTKLIRIVLLAWAGWMYPAHAALTVLTCEPEWAALTMELAGDAAQVTSATTAWQDPHHIEAKPSLLAKARRADLVVCSGAELEIGWLPVLLEQSGNWRIQPGQPGYFEAASQVQLLEIPQRVDRSMGDVHASGNPHLHLDPRNIAKVAVALTQRLRQIDPEREAHYRQRGDDFLKKWHAAIAQWQQQAAPLKGMRWVVHHNAFVYLEHWLTLTRAGTLEPLPGVAPSTKQLAHLLKEHQAKPVAMVVRAPHHDARPAQWFATRAQVPLVVLPFTVGGSDRAQDLWSLFDDTVNRLLQVQRANGAP